MIHIGALQFYNDEHDKPAIQIKKPPKSRKSKYMTKENYRQRLADWEASLPHNVEVKSKGNSMRQVYYTEWLLPIYVNEIHDCRPQHGRSCIFQEDNDPSHGTKSKDNIVRRFKANNWVETLIHPPQSPDLNPTEGVWNILKQYVKQHRCRNVAELKRVILIEWEAITMEQIRKRIREMPDRCKQVVASNGAPIKGGWWCINLMRLNIEIW